MAFNAPWAGTPPGLWAALCQGAGQAAFAAWAIMWALMAAAMMSPTFVSSLRTALALPATMPGAAAALVAGYGAVWLGAAGLGAAAQGALSRAGWIGVDGARLSAALTAALLRMAGLYQFSVLKAACLARCRRPVTFFPERWAPGPLAAFRMGAALGALGLGCCWTLMALAFVGGSAKMRASTGTGRATTRIWPKPRPVLPPDLQKFRRVTRCSVHCCLRKTPQVRPRRGWPTCLTTRCLRAR